MNFRLVYSTACLPSLHTCTLAVSEMAHQSLHTCSPIIATNLDYLKSCLTLCLFRLSPSGSSLTLWCSPSTHCLCFCYGIPIHILHTVCHKILAWPPVCSLSVQTCHSYSYYLVPTAINLTSSGPPCCAHSVRSVVTKPPLPALEHGALAVSGRFHVLSSRPEHSPPTHICIASIFSSPLFLRRAGFWRDLPWPVFP